MHLEVFIRGEYLSIQKFIQSIYNIYFTDFQFMKADNKGQFIPGTKEKYKAQMSIRTAPLGIYEIIFPEQHLDIVLNSVLKGGDGKAWRPYMNKYVSLLRVFLGLQKLPKYKKEQKFDLYTENMEIIVIGIKKDKKDNLGNEFI